jgi:hypothetical protein
MGATNQDVKNRKAFGHQPDPSAHDPRNDTLVYAAWAEGNQVRQPLRGSRHDLPTICARDDGWPRRLDESGLLPLHQASTRLGVPPPGGEALKRKLKKDISFALRRGTIAKVTTALDAAQRAAEAGLAVNEVGLAW